MRVQIAQAEGDCERAIRVLRDVAATLPDDEPLLPYFPVDVTDQIGLVRLALSVGDQALGQAAVELASERASLNPTIDTVVGAATHARGLLDGDLALLRTAIERFEQLTLEEEVVRENARRFGRERFRAEMARVIEHAADAHQVGRRR